jgi:quinol monooxygenase YgiN
MTKRGAKKSAGKRARTSRKRSLARDEKLPKDAVTLTVILRARPGQQPLLEAELRALVGPTRREDGCLVYDLHRGADVADSYLLHEVWGSREHHRMHTLTPHFIRWNARKDALLVSREATFWKQLV